MRFTGCSDLFLALYILTAVLQPILPLQFKGYAFSTQGRLKEIPQEKGLQGIAKQAAVALIGPRQVEKTTLALNIAANREGAYL